MLVIWFSIFDESITAFWDENEAGCVYACITFIEYHSISYLTIEIENMVYL